MTKKRSSEFFGVKIDIFPKKVIQKCFRPPKLGANWSPPMCTTLYISEVTTLESVLYIIGYNNISRRLPDTHLTILHSKIPHPPCRIDAYKFCITEETINEKLFQW